MAARQKDTRYGYYLRVLKFLCKRHNVFMDKQKNPNLEYLSFKTTSKTWGTLLKEVNSYRDKSMKASSLERSLRELKRREYLIPMSENSSCYIVSLKGFRAVGINMRKIESKERARLPDRDKTHTNVRCRKCNVIDGYSSSEDKCRYCGAKLYTIDKI
ncbi:MAG: hypothetical protein PHW62_06860 [Candidatus Ratteibacteria bacterium]|nr:hypothetical protein [Candidatus Ratteibacteria bacterium]